MTFMNLKGETETWETDGAQLAPSSTRSITSTACSSSIVSAAAKVGLKRKLSRLMAEWEED